MAVVVVMGVMKEVVMILMVVDDGGGGGGVAAAYGAGDVAEGATFEGKDDRQTQKSNFINNTTVSTINGKTVKERQSLSKALRPEADE